MLFSSQETFESPPTAGVTTEQLIERMLDPRDTFSRQIKELVINDWTLEKREEIVHRILDTIENLESFKWELALVYRYFTC